MTQLKDRLGRDIVVGSKIVYAAGSGSSVHLNYAKVVDIPFKDVEYWVTYPGRADDNGVVQPQGVKAIRRVYRIRATPWYHETDTPAVEDVWGRDANGKYVVVGTKPQRNVTLQYPNRVAVIG